MAEGLTSLKRVDEGPVATVALARPEARNALNAALIAEITRCFGELAEDDDVRVVVLTGEGSSFCAGADIGYMRDTAGFSYEENLEDARRLAEMFRSVDELPKPVVAKVRGAAIGGGAGLGPRVHRRNDRTAGRTGTPRKRRFCGVLGNLYT